MPFNHQMPSAYNRQLHEDWANGFYLKNTKEFHPYTKKEFFIEFDKNLKINKKNILIIKEKPIYL